MKKLLSIMSAVLIIVILCGCAERSPVAPADSASSQTAQTVAENTEIALPSGSADPDAEFAQSIVPSADKSYTAEQVTAMIKANEPVYLNEIEGCGSSKRALWNSAQVRVERYYESVNDIYESSKESFTFRTTSNMDYIANPVKYVLPAVITPLRPDGSLYCVSVRENDGERYRAVAVVEGSAPTVDAENRGASFENAVPGQASPADVTAILKNGGTVLLKDVVLPPASKEISTMLASTTGEKNIPLLEADPEHYRQLLGDGTGKKVAAEIIARYTDNGVKTKLILCVYMPDDLLERALQINADGEITAFDFIMNQGDRAVVYKIHEEKAATLEAFNEELWNECADAAAHRLTSLS